MYRLTLIEDASMGSGSNKPEVQENDCPENEASAAKPQQDFLQKTAQFLHKYLNQPNCVRIFISKN